MSQRKPNSLPPPRPVNGEETFWIDLADPLHVETPTFFPPPDGHYLRLEICMRKKARSSQDHKEVT